jgi:hypothetical protein
MAYKAIQRTSIALTDGAPISQVGEAEFTPAKYVGQECIADNGTDTPKVYSCVSMSPVTWVELA